MEEVFIDVMVANDSHLVYVPAILATIGKAAKIGGTGMPKGSNSFLEQ